MKTVLAFVCACFISFYAAPASAAPRTISGPVVADVLSVYDGDTLTVIAHPWPGVMVQTSVRLNGLDTPEIRGKCTLEKALALQARDALIALAGERIVLHNITLGKYAGRVVADITTPDGVDIVAALIAAGLAKPYDGGTRQSWCPAPVQETPPDDAQTD